MEASDQNRTCTCARCRSRGYMAPAVLLTLGVLFLIAEFVPRYDFDRTWPILLIVIGLVKILQWSSPMTGHVDVSQIGAGSPPPGIPPGDTGQTPAGGQEVSHG